MASEKIPASVPGKTGAYKRPPKKPKSVENPNPSGDSMGQNQSKDKAATEAGKDRKVHKARNRTKKPKPPKVTMPTQVHPNDTMRLLHERTKLLRTKLARMKHRMSKDGPLLEHLAKDDLIVAIKKLQLNDIRPVLVTRQTSDSGEQATEVDEVDEVDEDDEVDEAAAIPLSMSRSERKYRHKTKDNRRLTGSEDNLHEFYVNHINRIVSGVNADKGVTLKYAHGDNLEEFAQKCVEAGLGQIAVGEVRVNAKNNHQSFLSLDEGPDAMISSMAARMYAMDGDTVRVFVRNLTDKPPPTGVVEIEEPADDGLDVTMDDGENIIRSEVEILANTDTSSPARRLAFVTSIVARKGNRDFVGSISFRNSIRVDSGEYYKFRPRDMKVSMIYVPVESCKDIVANQTADDMMGLLYVAEVTTITDKGRCIGVLKEPVGKCGNLESEIKAILLHNGMKDIKPYEERFVEMFAEPSVITSDDMKGRLDLRDECIFTIDPLTARDLDDAVSCKQLPDGNYEIGVHISDVTAYLQEGSELDDIVKLRATSIYLANEVIHMLPSSLCRKCSLLPGELKLAFSVFWVMNEQGEVQSTRFTRSIIRSCTQLAYEHAQKIIDNPQEQFTIDDFPTICGKFTVNDIVERTLILNKIAENMRKQRYANGCLSIDNPEFYFQFDPKTGEPISFDTATRLSANFLIEEFMLQANQSVAQFIYKRFPGIAFLRNHQPPKQNALNNLKAKLAALGIVLNMESSKAIHDGMQKICAASSDPEAMSAGLSYLLTKPMVRSKYFRSSVESTPADLFHYALAVPIYTHFTSPIRRYPDVIVHRLLAAALDYQSPPKRTAEELDELAKICNDQKYNAKNASDESANLFFMRYVKANSTVKLRAVVTDIYRHSIEVITLKTGRLITLPFKIQKVIVDASHAPSVVHISEKNSRKPMLELRLFSALDIILAVVEGKLIGFFDTPDCDEDLGNCSLQGLKLSGAKKAHPRRRRDKKPRARGTKEH